MAVKLDVWPEQIVNKEADIETVGVTCDAIVTEFIAEPQVVVTVPV